jgi:IS5 family transposase
LGHADDTASTALHEAVLGKMDNQFLDALADRIADRLLLRLSSTDALPDRFPQSEVATVSEA